MNKLIISFMTVVAVLTMAAESFAAPKAGNSVYGLRPDDPGAVYFTPEEFGFVNDGKSDVSDALQAAINKVKTEQNFGVLYIPEGRYRISRTITIPAAVRVIGYGEKRPEFYLARNTPGYQEDMNWMFWFTGGLAREGRAPSDAGAGTFYSAISNVDFRIEKGNPAAVAVRSHFAQHSFVSHCDFHIGDGLAGIYDVGNEIEDLRFFGGQYGITSGRTSPGWPMMMIDTYFSGQKKAAVLTREVGFAVVGMQAENVPVVFEMQENTVDRLYVENSLFRKVSRAAVVVSTSDNTFAQLNMKNVQCSDVPVLVSYRQTGEEKTVAWKEYVVNDYVSGLVYDDMASKPRFVENADIMASSVKAPAFLAKDLPALPSMDKWVSVADYGAKGDGVTDDTEAFEKAMTENDVVFVPQGWYRISRTLKMRPGTALIGMHPFATQLVLAESEPAFSGFGTPVPLLESSEGGDDILNGIGIFTGAYNYRAVGCKWMAGKDSYLNDVKFVGGHGTMRKPVPASAGNQAPRRMGARQPSSPTAPVYVSGMDQAWDNQYWSLWITNGGGGTVKDVWTADTYAGSGLYVSETSTPGRIYCMSLEHHVRTEARFHKVSNWKVYAFQFEEEGTEGPDSYFVEMSDCDNLLFANVWMYRVIRAKTPKDKGMRMWRNSNITVLNMHNYTQILPVIEYPLYDMSKAIPVTSWDFARLTVTGDEESRVKLSDELYVPVRIATGFDFAAGAAADSKGNVYFAENLRKKIYKWSAEDGLFSLIADHPWKPFSLVCDTEDNLIVTFRYDPQPGYMVDGKQETVETLPDDNPMYSGWGNGGWRTLCYSIDPDSPDASMKPLERVLTSSVPEVRRMAVPSSRWRGDFAKVVSAMPEYSYVAPDGVTLIPDTYDLSRNCALVTYAPGQDAPVYITNENNKTTSAYKVEADGRLTPQDMLCPFGQYSNVTDAEGNVYVADGHVYVYAPDGTEKAVIEMPERPISIAVGGVDGDRLIVTSTMSVYSVKIR